MNLPQSFRAQARRIESLARATPMGAQRILLSREAKTLYEAAERAERADRGPAAPDPA